MKINRGFGTHMSTVTKFRHRRKEDWAVTLDELSWGMKRMLSIQIRELIHKIEDVENEVTKYSPTVLYSVPEAS